MSSGSLHNLAVSAVPASLLQHPCCICCCTAKVAFLRGDSGRGPAPLLKLPSSRPRGKKPSCTVPFCATAVRRPWSPPEPTDPAWAINPEKRQEKDSTNNNVGCMAWYGVVWYVSLHPTIDIPFRHYILKTLLERWLVAHCRIPHQRAFPTQPRNGRTYDPIRMRQLASSSRVSS